MGKVNVFWFRRDLRLEDNHGLYQALSSGLKVLPIFVFDSNILNDLEDKSDARLTFIHNQLERINKQLIQKGSRLHCYYGKAEEVIQNVLDNFQVEAVYSNRDYEPYAISRDQKISNLCKAAGVNFFSDKDQVIFEKDEIIKGNGTPYLVYTPYSKKWLSQFKSEHIKPYLSEQYSNYIESEPEQVPPLKLMGFKTSDILPDEFNIGDNLLLQYEDKRNIPAVEGTSKVGVHLRFGTISIRKLIRETKDKSYTYLKELIWREFFMMILYHYPHVVSENFNAKYDNIVWRNNEQEYNRWCTGDTGFPMVDAGMRELNETGHMHNRVRMITASFLCKHLLIDWKWGEAYFAKKLLDYELASNNGNWQWAAGTGVDAAPYFRVFNPLTQAQKFDKNMVYINKWIKNLNELSYPTPIVDHKFARERAIETYKKALN